jgi:hypothetical protein
MISEMDNKITKINFSRLGKPNSTTSDKPRPIKVALSNATEVFKILRSQSNLRTSSQWADIRIASDRTSMQRNHMSKLRNELQKRKAEGENDLIIKYIKGTLL